MPFHDLQSHIWASWFIGFCFIRSFFSWLKLVDLLVNYVWSSLIWILGFSRLNMLQLRLKVHLCSQRWPVGISSGYILVFRRERYKGIKASDFRGDFLFLRDHSLFEWETCLCLSLMINISTLYNTRRLLPWSIRILTEIIVTLTNIRI